MTPSQIATNLPGRTRMLEVLRAGLRTAERIALSVSFLRFSGTALVVEDLKRFIARGGSVRILTSNYLFLTQPDALRQLLELEGVEIGLYLVGHQSSPGVGFHTKLFIFDGSRRECWVGSSNLSRGGLTSNIEANLLGNSESALDEAWSTFEVLWNRPEVVQLDQMRLDAYSRAFTDAFVEQTLQGSAYPLPSKPKSPAGEHEFKKPQPNEAQKQALASLERLRRFEETKAVVIAAPGVGKTYLSAFDAQSFKARKVLFISHRLEHLTQAKRTFESVFGDTMVTGLVYGDLKEWSADMVFATIQTAANQIETFVSIGFDYVVVDEFHHAAAPTYRALLGRIQPGFLLGLTATPERADGHDVIELCDYNVAYEVRLLEAIKRDWLLPFHYFGIADETVDYQQIPWRNRRFDPAKLQNALMLEERVDHILEHAQEKGYDGRRRATAGFCAGVRHAKFMAQSLNERGLVSECLTGEDSLERRESIYARLEDPDDELEWLFVADLLNEGVDIPGLNSLLFLRPTESPTVFLQQLGRGLRLHPDCEVLTVLDFVGHHRNAWLTLETLHDASATPGPSTVEDLDLTPPRGCEVILDDVTIEILRKVRSQSRTYKEKCLDAYRQLRSELGRPPFPVDLLSQRDAPDLSRFRTQFGTWLELRRDQGDAEQWEEELEPGDPAFELLAAVERNWQQPRVYAYALVWGMCANPSDPREGYRAFFERFPRWKAEFQPTDDTNVWESLEKKIGELLNGETLKNAVVSAFPNRETLILQVERRLQYTLESDFRMRHGGVLRTPDDLVLHEYVARPEIINHFGLQYDPARHNTGVITFNSEDPEPNSIVIITKLDTSSALEEFHYQNQFSDPRTFHWQSQNRQRQDNEAGRVITEHGERGTDIHLFVQKRSHAEPLYMGLVEVVDVQGDGPMDVTYRLRSPVPPNVLEALGVL